MKTHSPDGFLLFDCFEPFEQGLDPGLHSLTFGLGFRQVACQAGNLIFFLSHDFLQPGGVRLASVGRALTTLAAAALLLVFAVPLVIMPMPAQAQGNAQSVTYRVTFTGKFTDDSLASGVSAPSGEHFTTLIGAVHNGSVTFWSNGGTASAGIESMAEDGGTSALESTKSIAPRWNRWLPLCGVGGANGRLMGAA